ncbi:hypothetical protein [Tropicimonas sediminicola]|uniref:Uncharacterized protein n=1 Tax=Tropicimonas sediminicola TaxID=1031541 RepID=A0A239H317_9RHOB|nr:hypothetical protein [Tropicimonas sediminicola]SNS75581.1 hypothetical protein SAMN05421757_103219 [Tropicimonas sediminicola]
MRGIGIAGALAAGLAAPGQAGQPLRESLVECSVLVELLLGEQSFQPGENAMIDLYVSASRSMREEALRRTSEGYVAETALAKREAWHARWDAGDWDDPANRDELVDWWTYCFKLADHLALKP